MCEDDDLLEDFTQSFLSIRLIVTGIYEDTDCCQG